MTIALGQAFLYQPQDVMDSVQRLRARALTLGNLQTTPQDSVVVENGIIEILPASAQVVYVPVYQPALVYFQRPHGVPFISFGIHLAIGPWLTHDFDWHEHHVIVWHRDHPRPADWWSGAPASALVQSRAMPLCGGRTPVPMFPEGIWIAVGVRLSRKTRLPRSQPRSRPGTTVRPQARPESQPRSATGQSRTPAPRTTPPRPQQPDGALIGIQSSHDARQYSNRGQESRHPAAEKKAPPPSKPASGAGKR